MARYSAADLDVTSTAGSGTRHLCPKGDLLTLQPRLSHAAGVYAEWAAALTAVFWAVWFAAARMSR